MTTATSIYDTVEDYSRGNGPGKLTVSKNSPMSDLGDWVLDQAQPGRLSDPTDVVLIMSDLAKVANEYLHYAVTAARDNGASWSDIGQCLGVSRQAAHERFNG